MDWKQAVLESVFRFYLWGGLLIIVTAATALLAATLLNNRKPGQLLDVWLIIWLAELWVGALLLYIGGSDLNLLEQKNLPEFCGSFGCESDFYFGGVKGTVVTGLVVLAVYLVRGKKPPPRQ